MKGNKAVATAAVTAISLVSPYQGLQDAIDSMSQDHPPLSPEQLECLKRCARGLLIRFVGSKTITALVDGGYAERGVAGCHHYDS